MLVKLTWWPCLALSLAPPPLQTLDLEALSDRLPRGSGTGKPPPHPSFKLEGWSHE